MEDGPKHPGRPRDEAAGPAILGVARRLVLAKGYEAVSIAEIIRIAGVSRQSLYRRWPTKADLVLEAFFEAAVSAPDLRPGQPVRLALLDFLDRLFDQLRQDGRAIRSLIAASVTDPSFGRGFQTRFVAPREGLVGKALEQAVERGELPANSDLAMMSAVIHGAFWYRLLNGMPLDATFAEGLLNLVFSPQPPEAGRRHPPSAPAATTTSRQD